jgi:hypothetical protein
MLKLTVHKNYPEIMKLNIQGKVLISVAILFNSIKHQISKAGNAVAVPLVCLLHLHVLSTLPQIP